MTGSTLDPSLNITPVPEESRDNDALGPSDSSDSGSDIQGAKRRPMDVDDELDAHALEAGPLEGTSDTDRAGTGERASADGDGNFEPDSDIVPRGTVDIADIADELGDVADDIDDADGDVDDSPARADLDPDAR